MSQHSRSGTIARALVTTFSCALGLALASAPMAPRAMAGTPRAESSEEASKTKWQGRYQGMLARRDRMHADLAGLEKSLASVQHAKHPRGAARHQFQQAIAKREQEIAQLEAEIASFHEEARRASIPPGWLTEVEDRHDAPSAPAAYEDEAAEDRGNDSGRNPLYDRDRGDRDEDDEEDDEESDDRRYKPRRLGSDDE